jgi:hypothetical protein
MRTKSLLLSAVATLGLTTAVMAQVPSYVPTNGLVGWWPFNGNANDESGNGNNGTVHGASLSPDRFGNSNKAFYFNGIDNFIACTDQGLPFGNSARSISVWINSSIYPLNNSTNNQSVLSYGTNGLDIINEGIEILFWRNSSNVNYLRFAGIGNDLETQISYNLNTWYHIVATFDGLVAKLYFNSVQIDSGSYQLWNTISNGLVKFGTTIVPSFYFNGNLDDIGIWNQALTQQEISDLYNATSCTNDLTVSPQTNVINTGNTASFTATTSEPNPNFVWQSDFGQGYQTLNDVGSYSGTTTNTLSISNVQLSNHNQPIRAISTSGTCEDTSNVVTIQLADTCIETIYDTVLITVTDTLIINTTLGLPVPNTENTILIYPNPANDHITIDNGNFSVMAGYSIKITNNAGQQVFQSTINQAQFYFDLSTWTGNGLYYVHLIDPQNNTLTIRKLVLQ